MNYHDTPQDEPAEHVRFAAYLSALEQVGNAHEIDLIREVLTDPDQAMAQSAVVQHLDRRAGDFYPGPAYEPWATSMAQVTAPHAFLVQRLHEWSLFRAVTLGQPWHADALLDSSNWLQLKAAAASNTDAVRVLAERGRTKRIRNAAKTHLQRHSSH
jgi:hypothetical protein